MCETIDGASVGGFQFSLGSTRGDGRHWTLQIRHPQLGQPDVAASVEFARRPLILRPEWLSFVNLPVHRVYDIEDWERRVWQRFVFLAALDEAEQRWAHCDPRHRHQVETAISAGGFT